MPIAAAVPERFEQRRPVEARVLGPCHDGDRCRSHTVATRSAGREREEDPRFDRLERPELIGRLEGERATPAEREQVFLRVDPRLLCVQDGEVLAWRGDVAAHCIDERVAQHPVTRVGARDQPCHRLVLRRLVARPEERRHCEPNGDERSQRQRYRRQAAPKRGAGEHPESESEHGVGRHDEALDLEAARAHAALETVERLAPPRHDRAQHDRAQRHRQREQQRLREQPPATRHGLRPGKPMCAVLQLASEERRADEHPHERRQKNQVARDVDAASELTLEVAHDDVAARARGRRQAGGKRFPLVGRPHRQPGDQRGERETDDQCEADEQLVAMLPPGHPCHRSRPFSGAVGPGRRSGAM